MKKIIAATITTVIFITTLFSLTSFAWSKPKLAITAEYDGKRTVTVQYRLLDFAGTESGDFLLEFPSDVLKYKSFVQTDMKNVVVEAGVKERDKNSVAISFIDLEHVTDEDCEADGSATIATLTFKVKDKSVDKVTLKASAADCYMDPDSKEVTVFPSSVDVTISDAVSDSANVKKVVVAAIVVFLILVIGIIVTVKRINKQSAENDSKDKGKNEKPKKQEKPDETEKIEESENLTEDTPVQPEHSVDSLGVNYFKPYDEDDDSGDE